MHFDVHQLDQFLLIGSGVTLLAVLAVRLSSGIGLPSLLIYLFIGVLLGESGLGLNFEDAGMAHALGFGALVMILAEGGLSTRWRSVRGSMKLGGALATLGVLVSVGIVALGGHYLLGLEWQIAVLLGAVCSPTDAAAVFSVLRVVPLPHRLTGALEAESGLNDAPTVVLVTLVSTGAFAEYGVLAAAGIVVYEIVAGVLVGLAVGFLGAWVMRRVALPSAGLYPVAVVCLALLAYALGAQIHASGFAAVYVAALVLGNAELPHRVASKSFAEGLGWLAQIGLFVMLGLLLSPDRVDLRTVALALAAGAILSFVARPVSVLVSSLVIAPFGGRLSWRDLTFLSWAGLRGAVPIVLATIPLAEGVPGANELFDLVFVMVVVFTLLTGPSLPWVARFLGVTDNSAPRRLEIEAAPLDRLAADLLQVTITEGSKMHGVEVGELRLPHGASVSLVVRDQVALVPQPSTTLREGDELLVVTPRALGERTEARLAEVSRRGRLATWLREPKSSPRKP